MGIQEYLQEAMGKGASDLFIVAGLPLTYKINRKMIKVGDRLMPEDTRKLIEDIYAIAQERKIETLEKNGDDDFSFSIPNLGKIPCFYLPSERLSCSSNPSDCIPASKSRGA